MSTLNIIQRPPGFELFFAPLQIVLCPNDFEKVKFAYIASKFGHAGQKRDNGRRYFDHPKNAAWIGINELKIRDPRILIAVLLHDQSEDSYLLSPYRIALNFGEDSALDIRALTKLPKGKEITEAYLMRIVHQGPHCIVTKLLDRLDNLRDMDGCDDEKKLKQVRETRDHHLPTLIPALKKPGDIWTGYAELLEEKIMSAISEIDISLIKA